MPYQPAPEVVEEWANLLDQLAMHVEAGQELEIEVPPGTNSNAFAWRIYNALHSAAHYPRNKWDETLKDRVKLKQRRDAIVATPKTPPPAELKAKTRLRSWEEAASEVWAAKEEVEIAWAVQEEEEAEHNRFRETLKHQFEEIQLLKRETFGDHVIRRYSLVPRERALPKQRDYRQKSVLDPEERRRQAQEAARELEEEIWGSEEEES